VSDLALTRKQVSKLPWRAHVWLRDLTQPEIDAVEGSLRSHCNGYVNFLLPSGELVSVAYDTEVDLDWPSTDDEQAVSEDGRWLVVEQIDMAARVEADAKRLKQKVQQMEESWSRTLA
jgi:hypothetical protein